MLRMPCAYAALRRQRTPAKPKDGELMKQGFRVFIPSLIAFGPMFIAIPAAGQSLTPYLAFLALAGGFGLGAGLIMMFRILMRQEKEILRLGKLVAGEEDKNI